MNTSPKRFSVGFAGAAVAAAFVNLVPYLRTRDAYNGDGFEVIGFPFTFRRLGGIAGLYEFHLLALLADIILALLLAAVVGYAFGRVRQTKLS